MRRPVVSSLSYRGERLFPYWFLAPSVVMLVALTVYPLIFVLHVSVHRLTPAGDVFVGLRNYARILQDGFFYRALAQTLIFAGTALVLEFLLGLALALLLDSEIRGRAFWRTLFLLPMILPPVVAGVTWRLIYNPNFGVLNGILRL